MRVFPSILHMQDPPWPVDDGHAMAASQLCSASDRLQEPSSASRQQAPPSPARMHTCWAVDLAVETADDARAEAVVKAKGIAHRQALLPHAQLR